MREEPIAVAEGEMIPEDGHEAALLHNLLLFSRILHGLGLEVNPGRMIEIQAAFAANRQPQRARTALGPAIKFRYQEIPTRGEGF